MRKDVRTILTAMSIVALLAGDTSAAMLILDTDGNIRRFAVESIGKITFSDDRLHIDGAQIKHVDEIENITFDTAATFTLTPNPTRSGGASKQGLTVTLYRGEMRLNGLPGENGTLQVALLTPSGRLAATLFRGTANVGETRKRIPLNDGAYSSLSSGAYIIRVLLNGQEWTETLTVIR